MPSVGLSWNSPGAGRAAVLWVAPTRAGAFIGTSYVSPELHANRLHLLTGAAFCAVFLLCRSGGPVALQNSAVEKVGTASALALSTWGGQWLATGRPGTRGTNVVPGGSAGKAAFPPRMRREVWVRVGFLPGGLGKVQDKTGKWPSLLGGGEFVGNVTTSGREIRHSAG